MSMGAGQRFTDRMRILVGEDGLAALARTRVAVYGLGGVGAACAMDLARSGVGALYVVDFDRVDVTNINRLYYGYASTLGELKIEAFARFAREVNPAITIEGVDRFFPDEGAAAIIDAASGYHADCVDSMGPKSRLVAELCRRRLAFISSMGTAGRLEPERLRLGSMKEASGCPLAKNLRARLKRLSVADDFPVVWSDETPVKPLEVFSEGERRGERRLVQGSSPFVPQAAGHLMASWIVRRALVDARSRSTHPR